MVQSDDAPKRCAIYTRKSSKEGLEQNFTAIGGSANWPPEEPHQPNRSRTGKA
jgi:hypothetical protein